ncbi:superoxide dismutase [Kroppenstedtia pulmonis]|uniref:superoxide dismutase n=1 Tax=Kroppenstedtia pulmonis TaxID=1380685 RepID=UPI001FEAD2D3|nr:superoxide dismutase [Kroppenstedtia pulmonis]
MFAYPNQAEHLRQKLISFIQSGRRALDKVDFVKDREKLISRINQLELNLYYAPPYKIPELSKQADQIKAHLSAQLHAHQPSVSSDLHSERDPQSESSRNHKKIPLQPVPIGQHRLPPLPYPYNALEPYIDEKTMYLHHDEHHKSYVEGLNKAEIMMAKARKTNNFELIKHWEREAAFNGAGHYLHTIFWNIMSPTGGGKPTGSLALQIKQDFGSFEAFKKHFSAAADKVEGGGWAILVWSPRSHRLEILQAEKHQNLSQWDVVPLLVLDVWEHAYYLKYPNKRKKYIDAWWHVVNWPAVQKRYEKASKLRWKPW